MRTLLLALYVLMFSVGAALADALPNQTRSGEYNFGSCRRDGSNDCAGTITLTVRGGLVSLQFKSTTTQREGAFLDLRPEQRFNGWVVAFQTPRGKRDLELEVDALGIITGATFNAYVSNGGTNVGGVIVSAR